MILIVISLRGKKFCQISIFLLKILLFLIHDICQKRDCILFERDKTYLLQPQWNNINCHVYTVSIYRGRVYIYKKNGV